MQTQRIESAREEILRTGPRAIPTISRQEVIDDCVRACSASTLSPNTGPRVAPSLSAAARGRGSDATPRAPTRRRRVADPRPDRTGQGVTTRIRSLVGHSLRWTFPWDPARSSKPQSPILLVRCIRGNSEDDWS